MGCGCGKPKCGCVSVAPIAGCCGNVSPATPLQACTPAYNACAEDHKQVLINQQFYTSIKINNSWNVPACGGNADLSVSGIASFSLGAYLWNIAYGYFKVVGFNKDTQMLTIENPCIDGNAPVGTTIPVCSEFIVTAAPITAGGGGQPALFPYVAIDFTAPNVSTCLLITVTTVNGLVVGKNVQIGSGTYRIESIPDGTHITICNDGDGITPGTAVIALNEANQYQYPIILIDANPCTNDPVEDGCIIVCKDDIMSPLGGNLFAGSVPVLTEDDSCVAEWRLLEVPTKTCTTITCCLTLTPGEDTYTINVADSSQFTVGDILQIGTRTDRFTVTSIPDATHLIGTLDPIPGALVDIPPGTSICIVDCCELLQNEVDALYVLRHTVAASQAGVITNIDAADGLTTVLGNLIQYTINNPSANSMRVLVTVEAHLLLGIINGDVGEVQIDPTIHYSLVTDPPPGVLGLPEALPVYHSNDVGVSRYLAYHTIITPILPGGSAVVNARLSVEVQAFGTAEVNVAAGVGYCNLILFGNTLPNATP